MPSQRERSLRWPESSEAGLTMMELMVAILLSALLTAGMYYFLSAQQKTYTGQERQMYTQMNVWSALDHLASQVRTAGFMIGRCNGATVWQWNGSTGRSPSPLIPFGTRNGCNLLTTSPASCDGSAGVDSLTITSAGRDFVDPPPSSMASAQIQGLFATPSGQLNLIVGNLVPAFAPNDLLVLFNPGVTNSFCSVLKATGATTAGGVVPHDPDGVYNPPIGVTFFPPGGYANRSLVIRFGPNSAPRHYAVDTTRNRLVTWTSYAADPSNPPAAQRDTVAENIEDMQIAFGCDVNGDGRLAASEWSFTKETPNTTGCGTTPGRAGRITLVSRVTHSLTPGVQNQRRPEAEDHAAGTVYDDLNRTVLSSTVRTYNIGGW